MFSFVSPFLRLETTDAVKIPGVVCWIPPASQVRLTCHPSIIQPFGFSSLGFFRGSLAPSRWILNVRATVLFFSGFRCVTIFALSSRSIPLTDRCLKRVEKQVIRTEFPTRKVHHLALLQYALRLALDGEPHAIVIPSSSTPMLAISNVPSVSYGPLSL